MDLAAAETNQIRKKEKWQHILREILIPFIIAGIGMVAAGILFDIVEVTLKNRLKQTFKRTI